MSDVPNKLTEEHASVDAVGQAKKVLQAELVERRNKARVEVDAILTKYGFKLAARVIIEGKEIDTHIGLEQDLNWKPSLPKSEPRSEQ